MSKQDTGLDEVLAAMFVPARLLLEGRAQPFEDETFANFRGQLEDDLRIAVKGYRGPNGFVNKMKVVRNWSPKQSRAVANIFRAHLRGEEIPYNGPRRKGSTHPGPKKAVRPEPVKMMTYEELLDELKLVKGES